MLGVRGSGGGFRQQHKPACARRLSSAGKTPKGNAMTIEKTITETLTKQGYKLSSSCIDAGDYKSPSKWNVTITGPNKLAYTTEYSMGAAYRVWGEPWSDGDRGFIERDRDGTEYGPIYCSHACRDCDIISGGNDHE